MIITNKKLHYLKKIESWCLAKDEVTDAQLALSSKVAITNSGFLESDAYFLKAMLIFGTCFIFLRILRPVSSNSGDKFLLNVNSCVPV